MLKFLNNIAQNSIFVKLKYGISRHSAKFYPEEAISKLLKNLKVHLFRFAKGAFSAVTTEGNSFKLPFTTLYSCLFNLF